jgi:hypothetical protein
MQRLPLEFDLNGALMAHNGFVAMFRINRKIVHLEINQDPTRSLRSFEANREAYISRDHNMGGGSAKRNHHLAADPRFDLRRR